MLELDPQNESARGYLAYIERERAEARREDFRAHGAPDDVAGDGAQQRSLAAGVPDGGCAIGGLREPADE